MEYESWMGILGCIVFGGAGFLLLSRFPSILAFGYIYLVSAAIALIGTGVLAVGKGYPLRLTLDRRVWKRYVAMAAPLASYGVVMGVYSFGDSVMLGAFGLLEETGWYNAALRIVGLAIIPMNFVGPVFLPALSSAVARPQERLQRLFDSQLEIMIFVAFMIACLVLPLAPTIMEVAFTSSFGASALALQISIFVAFFQYLWTPYNQALIVFNQQRKVFLIHLVGALSNVVLNAVLIPRLSFYGASIASVLTQVTVLCLLFGAVRRSTPIAFSSRRVSGALTAAAVSAVVVTGTLYVSAGSGLGFLIAVVPGGSLGYALCFFTLRTALTRMGLGEGLMAPPGAWNSPRSVDVAKR
jgi:O-antigen/teichoic acid export membrane protein